MNKHVGLAQTGENAPEAAPEVNWDLLWQDFGI
jgi:hypothetical protein